MGRKSDPEPKASGERPARTPADEKARRPTTPAEDDRLVIEGPGAADFLTASSGLDTPESGTKGMGQTRDEGPLSDARRLTPNLEDDENRKNSD